MSASKPAPVRKGMALTMDHVGSNADNNSYRLNLAQIRRATEETQRYCEAIRLRATPAYTAMALAMATGGTAYIRPDVPDSPGCGPGCGFVMRFADELQAVCDQWFFDHLESESFPFCRDPSEPHGSYRVCADPDSTT